MKNGLPILLLLALTACRHDPLIGPEEPATGVLKVTFRPTWNGSDFHKENIYLTAANERVLIQMVKFYLSPIVCSGDTDATASRVELLDITNGPQERTFTMPVGGYDSLRFGLGLPYELNHADITDIDPASPLGSAQGTYWTWTTMYRFVMFDGRYDTEPGGTGTPPYQFSLHAGRDECYRERTIPAALSITDGGNTELVLNVDLSRFFTDGDQVLDLSQNPQVHGEVQTMSQAMRLSDFAVKAINAD